MMVDIDKLSKSDFWKKKVQRAVVTRDTDKSGFISRKDFVLVVERYRKLANSTEEKLKALLETMLRMCDKMGLNDGGFKYSYEEFEEVLKQQWASEEIDVALSRDMFACLDVNGDGLIDLVEWKAHIMAMGISPEHAQKSFSAMDSDADGMVTEDEFVNYHVEFFCSTENKLNSAILYGPL
jgi:Ca2+-binding EF-hand superfamily protein